MKKRLFVDMDGVLAKWHNVSIEEVTKKGYFANLEPMYSVVDAIKKLIDKPINNYEVFILSSVFVDGHSETEKKEWLSKYIPNLNPNNRLFVPYGTKKTDYLGETYPSDILLDDFTENLNSWHGVAVKLLNGINGTHGTWDGLVVNGKGNDPKIVYQALSGLLTVM